jgi:hypothetical protein
MKTASLPMILDMRKRMLHCAKLAGILGVVALIVELMPGWIFHLARTIVKARSLPFGYELKQPHLSLSRCWHIEQLVHGVTWNGFVCDEISRAVIVVGMCAVYAYTWRSVASLRMVRAGALLVCASMLSQGLSFLLLGGVVDLLAHTTPAGVVLSAVAISDVYMFVGGPLLICGLLYDTAWGGASCAPTNAPALGA